MDTSKHVEVKAEINPAALNLPADDNDIEKRLALAAKKSQDFKNNLLAIHQKIKTAKKSRKTLKVALKEIEPDLLELLDSSILTIYQSIDNGKEILANFKGGIGSDQVDKVQIRVPLSTTSLSGYVALSQRPILIKNVYDKEELIALHPRLEWDSRFCEERKIQFKSMVIVPIKDEILLGVVQLINLKEDREFTRADIKQATMLAQVLAKEFREELQNTQGPYDFLVQKGKISGKELDEVQKSISLSGGSISKILMDKHQISDDDIGKSLELYYRVPYMKYDKSIVPPPDLVENISATYLRNNLWLPILGDKEEVTILISDPSDYQKIMEIQGLLNAKNYAFRVGLPEHILQYLNGANEQGSESDVGFDDVFKSLEAEGAIEVEEFEEAVSDESAAESSAIIQLVNRIIMESERLGGSDIHVEPGKDNSAGVVRVRVDGVCRDILTIPKEHTSALVARIKVISRLDISERRLPQDGKCKLKIKGKIQELRVATVPTVNGESVVLRLLANAGAMPVENLSLSERNSEKLLTMAAQPHGLLLVVGPTGSGKTTTLHAVLGHINDRDTKIWTAEDPVEITQPGLQQVQVQNKIGFTFAMAMRAFLRADPDVILIGEMRDTETAAIGVEASLTGHLVLSTLHTNSAPETITRLLDLGLDPVNFSDALLGVLAQRLMRTLCVKCKEPYKPEESELNHLISTYGKDQFFELGVNMDDVELYRAVGCDACGDTGYKGRVGVHEVLVGTKELQTMIYNKASVEELRVQAIKDGMRTLKQDGIAKLFMGLSDYDQLMKITAE